MIFPGEFCMYFFCRRDSLWWKNNFLSFSRWHIELHKYFFNLQLCLLFCLEYNKHFFFFFSLLLLLLQFFFFYFIRLTLWEYLTKKKKNILNIISCPWRGRGGKKEKKKILSIPDNIMRVFVYPSLGNKLCVSRKLLLYL